ncbi:hypothetical protein EJB05_36499, partial [Eragrostis curvula]
MGGAAGYAAYGRPGGASAFDALGFLQAQQQQQGHHHAMQQQLMSGGGAAAGVQQLVSAAMASSHATAPDHQHAGLAAIAGTGSATVATSAPLRMQHFMAQDYAGLLQDMLPAFVQNEDGNNHRNP